METKRENLLKELKGIKLDDSVVRGAGELFYTAYETSMTDIKLFGDELITIMKIIQLAAVYGKDVPDDLRM